MADTWSTMGLTRYTWLLTEPSKDFCIGRVGKPVFGIEGHFPNITHVPTKVHVILRRSAVVQWMRDNGELV